MEHPVYLKFLYNAATSRNLSLLASDGSYMAVILQTLEGPFRGRNKDVPDGCCSQKGR